MNAPTQDMAQRSAAWFDARKGRITGSRVSAILGINPWQKPDDVLRAMVREYANAESEFGGNAATAYGTRHEPDAIAAYEVETGELVELAGLIVHSSRDWLAASPDGLIGDRGCVECKCPYSGLKRNVPDHYYHQVQLVMHCAGRDWCDYVEWSPDEIYIERVPIDADWLDRNSPALELFISSYQKIIADEQLMRPYLEPQVNHRDDADWANAVHDYKAAKAALEATKKTEAESRQRLIDMAEDKNTEGAGAKVTRVERSGSIDWSQFSKDHNLTDDAEQYRKPASVSWRITV